MANGDAQSGPYPKLGRGAVVVTGASTGIGRASAVELDRIGYRVFAGVRKDSDAEAIGGAGSDRLTPLLIDVADHASVRTAASAVAEEIGDAGLAGLVNNAGIAVPGPVEALPLDELRHQLEVNVIGQVAVTQAFLPAIRSARGRIIFMSSVGGRLSIPYMSPYHASKWAIEAIGDALRVEVGRFGVEVVLVEPGSIATPIWEKGDDAGTEIEERMEPHHRELYGEQLNAVREAARKTGEEGIPPERVAEVVAEALTAGKPRTRYLVGRDAKVNARVRRLAPDRLFDRLISRELGIG